VSSGQLLVVDRIVVDDGRTKSLVAALNTLGTAGRVVVVLSEQDANVRRASNNIEGVHVVLPGGLALLDLLRADHVILSQDAIAPVTAMLAEDGGRRSATAAAAAAGAA
jgi:large subunit ribosomal protein L4